MSVTSPAPPSADAADWFSFLRSTCDEIRRAVTAMDREARMRPFGRGAGGDVTVGVDRVAEDILIAALERRHETSGEPITLVSEEAGELHIGGPGGMVVIADPIDGSRNAKCGAPLFATSVAIADGLTMGSVRYAYVCNHGNREEFTAEQDRGAWLDEIPLRVPHVPDVLRLLAVEGASAGRIAAAAGALMGEVGRLRSLGSMALSMCWVAAGRMDGLLGLGAVRAMDVAAGQLVLREAGCWVGLPDASDVANCPLDLVVRRRVIATAQPAFTRRMRRALDAAARVGPE